MELYSWAPLASVGDETSALAVAGKSKKKEKKIEVLAVDQKISSVADTRFDHLSKITSADQFHFPYRFYDEADKALLIKTIVKKISKIYFGYLLNNEGFDWVKRPKNPLLEEKFQTTLKKSMLESLKMKNEVALGFFGDPGDLFKNRYEQCSANLLINALQECKIDITPDCYGSLKFQILIDDVDQCIAVERHRHLYPLDSVRYEHRIGKNSELDKDGFIMAKMDISRHWPLPH